VTDNKDRGVAREDYYMERWIGERWA